MIKTFVNAWKVADIRKKLLFTAFVILVFRIGSVIPVPFLNIVDEINALGGEITNAYGIDANQLIEAGHCGINKINVDTDIRLAVTRNMKELFARDAALRNSASVGAIYELLEKNKSAFDPRVFITPIMDTVMYGNVPDEDVARICQCIEDGVKEVVGTLIVKFGSYGKAPKVELATLDEMAERYKKAGI